MKEACATPGAGGWEGPGSTSLLINTKVLAGEEGGATSFSPSPNPLWVVLGTLVTRGPGSLRWPRGWRRDRPGPPHRGPVSPASHGLTLLFVSSSFPGTRAGLLLAVQVSVRVRVCGAQRAETGEQARAQSPGESGHDCVGASGQASLTSSLSSPGHTVLGVI